MGGDHAPAEIVAGAVQAAAEGGVAIALVGDPEQVGAELAKHDTDALPIQVVPSEAWSRRESSRRWPCGRSRRPP